MTMPISLPSRVDLPAAIALTNELKAVNGPIEIIGAEVMHFGALGLQTLVAASRAAKERDDVFKLISPSEKMVAQMKMMGVTPDQLMEGAV